MILKKSLRWHSYLVMKPFFRDKLNLLLIILSLLLNLSIWFILKSKLTRSGFPMNLHYNVYFGVDYLGKYGESFVIPIVGIIVIAVNFFLGEYFFNRSKILSRLITISSIVIQIFLIIGAISVMMLNI